jgi:hypothetical protein
LTFSQRLSLNKLHLNGRPRLILSIIIFLVALWLYTSAAVPGLVVGSAIESESAELQRVANRLGIAHSTGYPLYTMLGYGMARLGDAIENDPYTWITYLSALGSAIGLVFFFQAALALGPAPVAVGLTLVLGVSDTMWHISTIAETQGLHTISVFGMVWLMIEHVQQPRRLWPLAGLAFLAGLGLANHRTIVLIFPAAGLLFLLGGAWRRLDIKQWALLIVLVLIPVASHGYLFWRVRDPYVVFSTRVSFFPSTIDSDTMVDLIRGELQDGSGLEGNIRLPKDDFNERLDYVWGNVEDELGESLVIICLIGLGVLALRNWRLGVMSAAYLIPWVVFLMSWRLDWKAVIYQHGLLAFLLLGVAAMAQLCVDFSQGIAKGSRWRYLMVASLLSLPIVWLGSRTYFEHRPLRDLSGDERGLQYYAAMEKLPPSTLVFTGGWTPDTFIMLEYMDEVERTDLLPFAMMSVEGLIQEIRNAYFDNYYISPFMRGHWGLYSEALGIPQQGIAFSGTNTDIFIQARAKFDPQLQAEAEAVTVVEYDIAPEIELYSYDLNMTDTNIELTLFWKMRETTETRYSVYTHLRYIDADGLERLLGQDDAFSPVEGTYPTVVWGAGEIVKDTYSIPLPDRRLPDGGSTVNIGMTLSYTGERVGEFVIRLDQKGRIVNLKLLG